MGEVCEGYLQVEPTQASVSVVHVTEKSGFHEMCLTCLWVEDLRGQVRRRRARREVFAAVGDEGGERVHVVCMLHHRDFVGLLRKM